MNPKLNEVMIQYTPPAIFDVISYARGYDGLDFRKVVDRYKATENVIGGIWFIKDSVNDMVYNSFFYLYGYIGGIGSMYPFNYNMDIIISLREVEPERIERIDYGVKKVLYKNKNTGEGMENTYTVVWCRDDVL